jgi:hypothetical protein
VLAKKCEAVRKGNLTTLEDTLKELDDLLDEFEEMRKLAGN